MPTPDYRALQALELLPRDLLPCSDCKEQKPIEAFPPYPRCTGRYGRSSICKACHARRNKHYRQKHPEKHREIWRRAYLKRAYGLTPERYEEMVEEHDGVCAICKKPQLVSTHGTTPPRLAVDHDHVTGEVRGLLCAPCNKGLGAFRDNPESLLAAVRYLKRST